MDGYVTWLELTLEHDRANRNGHWDAVALILVTQRRGIYTPSILVSQSGVKQKEAKHSKVIHLLLKEAECAN